MTIPNDPTIDIEESVERNLKCRGNYLHEGPLFWCMWKFVSHYTRRNFRDRTPSIPHYKDTEGLLCEKCILEFRALRVPNRKF